MKIISFVLLLTLLPLLSISGEAISGFIKTGNGAPIPSATIVLLELDQIVISNENGSFLIEDIDKGEFTLLIIAPGFIEKKISVSVPAPSVTITMAPEIIEMDTIIIKADTEDPVAIVNEGVTSKELERLPTRADPFESLAQESGILTKIDNPFQGRRNRSSSTMGPPVSSGRFTIRQSNEISVYGGESDWNNYYYDYIRIPTNKHTFGYPVPDAVVPVEAVDSIDVHKGAVPVEYGPGIGGTFIMNPKTVSDRFSITLTPSIMDISGISSFHISDNFGILLSINQSILNYTILPIITSLNKIEDDNEEGPELVEGDTPTSISYGDMLLHITFTPLNQYLAFDLLGFYDEWAFDISVDNISEDTNEIANLNSIYGPYYLAGGLKWIYSATTNFGNYIYTFASLYNDYGDFKIHFPNDKTIVDGQEILPATITDITTKWTSSVNSLQAGDEIQWTFNKYTSLLLGANGRLSDLSGTYIDKRSMVTVVEEGEGIDLNEDPDYDIPFKETIFSTYTYAKMIGEIPNFNYQLGTGLLWYPELGTVKPSLEGELIYSKDSWVFALSTGWSPGVIDEFTYINRRLDEIYYDLDTETSADKPPMAASASGMINYKVNEESSLKFTPYFSWYYNLSGISMSTSYTDLDDDFVSLDPQYGYSTGVDLTWNTKLNKYWDWDISYAYSLTRYFTESLGWVAPNTEVSHALKSSAMINYGGFTGGLNFLLYSGIPFTPEVVEDNGSGPEVIQGVYNTAVDYIPVYEFTTNLSYKWQFKKVNFSIFLNSSNWISGLNFIMSGLKDELVNKNGSTTSNFNSRNYDFPYSEVDLYLSLLMSEFGINFSY